MNIKTAVLAALLLTPGQAMAEDVRVDCVIDQRIVCLRDDETTCRPPVRRSATYHFTFDLTKRTGSVVFCSDSSCLEPSPLTVIHDYCRGSIRDADCLSAAIGGITVWGPTQKQTYIISDSRFVMTQGSIVSVASRSVIEFGRCAVQ
jgi:hypothetical protein